MPTQEQIRDWPGHALVGPEHEKLGKIEHVYVNRLTGEPTFAAVKPGLFGRVALVPIAAAESHGDHLAVGYSKEQIKQAPHMASDRELSEADESKLNRYYSAVDAAARRAKTSTPPPTTLAQPQGDDAADGSLV